MTSAESPIGMLYAREFVNDAGAIAFCEKPGFRLDTIKTGEAFTEFVRHSAD